MRIRAQNPIPASTLGKAKGVWMKGIGVFLGLFLTGLAQAIELQIEVRQADGTPLRGAVLFLVSGPDPLPPPTPVLAQMDQRDRTFDPHLLVVPAGSKVAFPNSDRISHHVYSFSETRSFELPLYKGDQHPPLRFEQSGLVVLGCNIHDWMLGYILVVPSDFHARSDAKGQAHLSQVPPGNYQLHWWHPRLRDKTSQQPVILSQDLAVSLRLEKPLSPPRSVSPPDNPWQEPY